MKQFKSLTRYSLLFLFFGILLTTAGWILGGVDQLRSLLPH